MAAPRETVTESATRGERTSADKSTRTPFASRPSCTGGGTNARSAVPAGACCRNGASGVTPDGAATRGKTATRRACRQHQHGPRDERLRAVCSTCSHCDLTTRPATGASGDGVTTVRSLLLGRQELARRLHQALRRDRFVTSDVLFDVIRISLQEGVIGHLRDSAGRLLVTLGELDQRTKAHRSNERGLLPSAAQPVDRPIHGFDDPFDFRARPYRDYDLKHADQLSRRL